MWLPPHGGPRHTVPSPHGGGRLTVVSPGLESLASNAFTHVSCLGDHFLGLEVDVLEEALGAHLRRLGGAGRWQVRDEEELRGGGER